jgi:hypothetical protein
MHVITPISPSHWCPHLSVIIFLSWRWLTYWINLIHEVWRVFAKRKQYKVWVLVDDVMA